MIAQRLVSSRGSSSRKKERKERSSSLRSLRSTGNSGAVPRRKSHAERRRSIRFSAVENENGDIEPCSQPIGDNQRDFWLPPPGRYPLRVRFSCSCLALSNVCTVSLSADVKFVITFQWHDSRFRGANISTHDLPGELWGPDISLYNCLVDCDVSYDSFALIDPKTGLFKRTITYHGAIRNPMDLKNFPFDLDDLELKFGTNSDWRVLDLSRFGNNPVTRIYTLQPASKEDFFYMGCPNEINEFFITGWSYNTYVPSVSSSLELHPLVFEFKFHLIRRVSYYFLKIFLPLWLLVLTSAAAFLSEVDDLTGRYEFLTIVLLAIVGFLYIVQESIPKVGFLTVIDKVVILSLLSVVISIFFSCLIAYSTDTKKAVLLNWLFLGLNQGTYWIANLVLIVPAYIRAQNSREEGISNTNLKTFKSANSLSVTNMVNRLSMVIQKSN